MHEFIHAREMPAEQEKLESGERENEFRVKWYYQMCKAIKNIQATDKKTMEKWVKKIGIINFMYLDTHDVSYTLPTLNLIFGSEGRTQWESESGLKTLKDGIMFWKWDLA